MAKTIDLNATLFDLVSEYPELKDILVELGFTGIANPAMLNTAGKVMTLPKGAAMKKVSIEDIVTKLEASGFEVKQ